MEKLKEIYKPIEKDLKEVNNLIERSFEKSESRSIAKISGFLLASPGKRIRPALTILSAKATLRNQSSKQLIKIAMGKKVPNRLFDICIPVCSEPALSWLMDFFPSSRWKW